MSGQAIQHPFVRTRSRVERLAASKLFWACIVSFFFFFPIYKSLNRTLPPPLPVLGSLGEWSLTNEHGKVVTQKDFFGKIVVLGISATDCGVKCEETLRTMIKIQHRLRGVGTKAAVLALTSRPETDTAEVLYQKSRELNANAHVWSFLTGGPEVVEDFFKLNIQKYFQLDRLMTSSRFLLIDGMGQARGLYKSSENGINKMMIDIGLLINTKQ